MRSLFEPVKRSTLVPRDYQQDAIDNVFNAVAAGQTSSLVRLPTGTGKTIVGSLIAERWISQGPEYRVLVLAHERQLIQQFADEIHDVLHIRPAIEMGEQHCSGVEPIIVASRQTLYVKGEYSRLYKFSKHFRWLVICDECHRWKRSLSSCKHIIEWFDAIPGSFRVGLTATPERSDKVAITELFESIAADYRLYDPFGGKCAITDGWAVPYDQRYIEVEGVDFKSIKTKGNDFDAHELERLLAEGDQLHRLCDPLLDLVGKRRTIIFSATTAMAASVSSFINARLCYNASESVDGSYADDLRRDIYRRHQNGSFQFLSVCGLCREGYNDRDIGCVAIFRPTKSRALAEQMKGRGCRPGTGVVSSEMTADERRRAIAESSKPACLVVDLVGATGLGDVPSTVELIGEGKPDAVLQLAKRRVIDKAKTETVDVAAEIRNAERDIDEERKRKEAAEATRLEEMRRLVAIGGQAKYTEHRVGHQDAFKSRSMKGCGGDYVMRFGKFKGRKLRQIPHWYLKWLGQADKMPRDVRNAINLYREEWKRENGR